MEICFKDKKLKALCEQAAVAQRKLGSQMARKLRSRLADLEAAASVAALRAGRPHPLEGNRLGQFTLDLVQPKRLVFEPSHEPLPLDEDGGIAWHQVTRVCIVWIGNYHD